ncbi:MAG: hypothetical protein ABI863_04740 [Ginsengibacter sp.]
MPAKLNITDKRMLLLPGMLIKARIIMYPKDFYEALSINKQDYYGLKRRDPAARHFSVDHILLVCKIYGIDGNWILGLQNENPFRFQLTAQSKPDTKGPLFLGKKKATAR